RRCVGGEKVSAGLGGCLFWLVFFPPPAALGPVIKIPPRRRRQAAARPGYYAMLTVGGCTSALTVIVVGTSRGGAGTGLMTAVTLLEASTLCVKVVFVRKLRCERKARKPVLFFRSASGCVPSRSCNDIFN